MSSIFSYFKLPRKPVQKNRGYCPTCDNKVTFISYESWLRDHYLCSHCGSLPRERALMEVIETRYPSWNNLTIHESSPINRGASAKLRLLCSNYIESQYFPECKSGSIINGIRCENLESLSFEDESVDIHITQDVLEHIYNPFKVFKEIARTLKPGGAHIFTVPLVQGYLKSKIRALKDAKGNIQHIEPPVYHDGITGKNQSLVTIDWGFDICSDIFRACNLFTQIISIDNIEKGIKAKYIEVLITQKPLK
jgi:SAM-dependent methyltransferase